MGASPDGRCGGTASARTSHGRPEPARSRRVGWLGAAAAAAATTLSSRRASFGQSVTLAGFLNGSGTLNSTGPGTLVVSAASSRTAPTNITGGTVVVGFG